MLWKVKLDSYKSYMYFISIMKERKKGIEFEILPLLLF